MKPLPALIGLVILTLSLNAQALRCGTQLVEKGDLKIQVEDKCGEPEAIEIVGYTLRTFNGPGGIIRERESVIEEWIYRFSNRYYDVLTFEAGRLTRIEKIRR